MPAIIHPRVTGSVSIEMTMTEAKTLIKALDAVLENTSTHWIGKVLRDESNGDTCNQFLQALKKTVD